MRAPSPSMKRPCGGNLFSTCRAVQAEKKASPPSASARSTRTIPTIQANAIIGRSPHTARKPALRREIQYRSLPRSPSQPVPVSHRPQPLDEGRHPGVGADQDTHLTLFDAPNDRLAGDLRRHREEGIEYLSSLRNLVGGETAREP